MAGHIDAEHQALHSQYKLKQLQRFARQYEDDQEGSGELGVATQQGQPVPEAAVDPHSNSIAVLQPPLQGHPQEQEVYQQRSHSDTEPCPHPSGLTHPPIPKEHPLVQAYKMGELHHGFDTAIHHVAKDVISAVDDESGRRIVTQQHVPHDPNLTCPYCEKQFRMGEIQKYRHHKKSCGTVV